MGKLAVYVENGDRGHEYISHETEVPLFTIVDDWQNALYIGASHIFLEILHSLRYDDKNR